MKRIILSVLVLLLVSSGYSQLNNSWINYSKTYYKFKLAKDSLCRIPQSTLAAIPGLGNVPAEQFQLWRNGQQVRLYTSVEAGPLGPSDFIEFWGEMNDGKPDKNLYRDLDYQLSAKYSLETDTACYYLTVNPAGGNLRYVQSSNVISGTVTADAYFMRRIEVHFKNIINRGYASVIGEYVYSSSYDIGEGWTSNEVFPCCALGTQLTNLNAYAAGPANSVMFTIGASGNALYARDLVVKFFNTTITPAINPMPFFNYHKDTVRSLPVSHVTGPNGLLVSINGNSTNANDRIVVSNFSVTYPATFNFNNEKNFYFELQPKAGPNYLVITNFNNNGIAPILYDINNGRRYLGDIGVAGQVRFELPGSTDPVRKFNLMSQDVNSVQIPASAFTTRNFVNVANTANQGDYLIVSHPALYNNGSGVNNVDLYRQYRSSVAGGSFNAKTYDIGELNDQFAFGIVRHPAAIRDFIRYAKNNFSTAPKYTFIIGHGLAYTDYLVNKANPIVEQLDLVQPFGWPASDVLLSCDPGTNVPLIPIGRLGAINGTEVGIYLEKMKQYEQVQASTVHTIGEVGWMKNVLHTAGGADSAETVEFMNYLNGYKEIIEDTLYGGKVETFAKTSVAAIEQQQSQRISELFNEGLSYVKYFGHSSANELAINLNYPETYTNAGKYPFMHVSGCTVGNFYTFNVNRPLGYAGMSLSEKYMFLPQKGAIGFLGSSHFGIAPFLDFYNTHQYKNFCRTMYGNTVGNQLQETLQALGGNPGTLDYYTRIHLEEINLHGDPALKINNFAKPDYDIEDQLVKFTPNIISVADNSFTIDIKMANLGRAVNDSIIVKVQQELPTGTVNTLYNQKIRGIRYMDSLHLLVPINPTTDKGLNKLKISLDDGHAVDELSEMNNTLTKEFYIFEDELRPISPYNFSIVNQQNISYYASTANPLSSQRQYVMEIDTTELFNSSFKKSYSVTGPGGVVQFNPTNITFTDNTVYYWRTATVPTGTGSYIWNNSSFIYLSTGGTGFNQSHYYQHLKSTGTDISYAPDRTWKFKSSLASVKMKNGVYPSAANQAQDFEINVDGGNVVQSVCVTSNVLIMSIFNPIDFEPVLNANSGPGQYGSDNVCGISRRYSFAYTLSTPAKRAAARDFIRNVTANGYYLVVMNFAHATNPNTYAADWKLDDPTGTNTLYHALKEVGFTDIDSFNRPRAFNFICKKNDNGTFAPTWKFSTGTTDKIDLTVSCPTTKGKGLIVSPAFGPARSWNQFHWRGHRSEATGGADSLSFEVIGIEASGTETTLYTVDSSTKDFDISAIDANIYPKLRLKMYNQDKLAGTPYQLDYWRLNYAPLPEGAVSPNLLFQMRDTVDQGDKIDFKLAFKNISAAAFDSMMRLQITIIDRNNVPHLVELPKGKRLMSLGDTLVISYQIDTRNYPGNNTLFVEVNPDNDQLEEYHFNNILYKDFFVRADIYNPLLDVTFDGVHILNKDIVSAKPHILVNLKDESRFLALEDTALIKVQVRYPDGSLHNYFFGDTMRFTPADLSTGQNSATIDFLPYFPEEGEYELIVSGRDVMGNTAGRLDYHVIFTVISKPMISNLLNYPNPFTTSTAFVFTITGSEVPQNIRIQVLTITGKIVREITKDELGPLHVGRNITEFKWDGTDMYGQKLANGVYLYRVITNLNGRSLDKYKATGDNTDKYFNKGYGKMVIIR